VDGNENGKATKNTCEAAKALQIISTCVSTVAKHIFIEKVYVFMRVVSSTGVLQNHLDQLAATLLHTPASELVRLALHTTTPTSQCLGYFSIQMDLAVGFQAPKPYFALNILMVGDRGGGGWFLWDKRRIHRWLTFDPQPVPNVANINTRALLMPPMK